MFSFILKIASGILGLWIAIEFINGVSFYGTWQDLLIIGLVMGVLNVFIKPILKLVTLPLRMLTLGLFSLVINVGIIWAVDIFFPELIITGIVPLLWTTLIVWAIGFLLPGVSGRDR
ncbi:MAG: phage holin family protein [Candidatus Pacebacteria bacterium]|jgi:putative membrane protein|nr:phage holin family protein [Candidatus Paceibacterota bacterium]